MKNSQKIIAGVLSGILLSTSLIIPTANAQSNRSIQNEIQLISSEENFKKVLIEIIESEKENFNDPSYGDFLIEKLQHDSTDQMQTRGKFTLTAKLGAKALKEVMNKTGQKGWDATIKKIEDNLGVGLVIFHWKAMNDLINVLSNSGTTITDAIADYLIKNGFNETFAYVVARAFVTVFF